VAAWSGEDRRLGQLTWDSARTALTYRDGERPSDRDAGGALWVRMRNEPGSGKPRFAVPHPIRQRRMMTKRLCQVCARPATTSASGTLWALPGMPDGPLEGGRTAEPPTCVACLPLVLRHCRAFGVGMTLAWVREAPSVGVHGAVYGQLASAPRTPVVLDAQFAPYSEGGGDALRRTLAYKLVVEHLGVRPLGARQARALLPGVPIAAASQEQALRLGPEETAPAADGDGSNSRSSSAVQAVAGTSARS
jgi:hypothetical protein